MSCSIVGWFNVACFLPRCIVCLAGVCTISKRLLICSMLVSVLSSRIDPSSVVSDLCIIQNYPGSPSSWSVLVSLKYIGWFAINYLKLITTDD